MSKNNFFKPTILYKEFLILDLIEKNKYITQREIGKFLCISVSMVNNYLNEFEVKGYIIRKRYSTKTIEYFVTKKGNDRRKLLNIWYLKASKEIYFSAKSNMKSFLEKVIEKGFKKILLYGAGDVAQIILDVIQNDKNIPLKILAIIDDDLYKENNTLLGVKIINPKSINSFVHDGILISSYTHKKIIYDNILKLNYNSNKIIQFFN